jgi:uncharacterized protein (TIGR03437 family)
MKRRTQILVSLAGGLLPTFLFSFASGPDPRHTGAPGDLTCATAGCHVGTAVNGGGGSAVLTSAAENTYTPGERQTLTLTITDSAARVYGFQASARLDSNPNSGQAGTFTAGAQQIVICANGSIMSSAGCPANNALQFIEHNRPFATNTIAIAWTPPASDVGPVTIYVAANAANNNGSNTGDRIYTTSLKLTPVASGGGTGGTKPAVASGGIVSASAFKSTASASPGGWIEIFGSNLSSTTRGWAGSDFNGNTAPTSLDGVSVTVGGRSAYVAFVSPGQVNALVPEGVAIGSGVPVVVRNGSSESDPVLLDTADVAPAILAPPAFAVGGRQYAVATIPGSGSTVTFAGATGSIPGASLRPARPGEVITLYGIGFGPVSPAVTPGNIATELARVIQNVTVQFGSTPANVQYAGLAPGFVGLYQFNVEVPAVTAGDHALVVSVNGTPVAQNVFLTTGQ